MACVYCFCRRDTVSSGVSALKRARSESVRMRHVRLPLHLSLTVCILLWSSAGTSFMHLWVSLSHFNGFAYLYNCCHPQNVTDYFSDCPTNLRPDRSAACQQSDPKIRKPQRWNETDNRGSRY